MNKIKMTRKDIKQYKNRIGLSYCTAHYMLWDLNPIGYNCGVYGWNYDIYELDHDTIIITGYRPMYTNINGNTELQARIEDQCENITRWFDIDYETKCQRIKERRERFLQEIL